MARYIACREGGEDPPDPEVLCEGDPDLLGSLRELIGEYEELARQMAAREGAGPDVAIMNDVNCPWTVAEALEMEKAYRSADLYWLARLRWYAIVLLHNRDIDRRVVRRDVA